MTAIQKLGNLEIELLVTPYYVNGVIAITRFLKNRVSVSISSTKSQTYSISKKVHPPFWCKDFPPLCVHKAGWDVPMLCLMAVFWVNTIVG